VDGGRRSYSSFHVLLRKKKESKNRFGSGQEKIYAIKGDSENDFVRNVSRTINSTILEACVFCLCLAHTKHSKIDVPIDRVTR